jgi:hypothetical protein
MQSSVAIDLTKPDALTHESVARLIASASDRTNTQLRVTKEGVAFISSTDVGADRIDGLAKLQQETTPEIGPHPEDLPASSHSFPVPYVRRSSNMVFNLITYQRLLFSDFLAAGGTIEQREFHTPHEFTTLPQKAIVNCPGYGARATDAADTAARGDLRTRL